MKRAASVLLLAATLLSAATLHNSDVLRMVRGGVPVSEIIARINASDAGFTLSTDDTRKLAKRGVPATVIKAMIARQAGDRFEPSRNPPQTGATTEARAFPILRATAVTAKNAPEAFTARAVSGGAKQLDNETVLKLLRSGLGEDVIAELITSRPGAYSTDADSLISLKQSGVSDKLIALMVRAGNKALTPSSYSAPPPKGQTSEGDANGTEQTDVPIASGSPAKDQRSEQQGGECANPKPSTGIASSAFERFLLGVNFGGSESENIHLGNKQDKDAAVTVERYSRNGCLLERISRTIPGGGKTDIRIGDYTKNGWPVFGWLRISSDSKHIMVLRARQLPPLGATF